MPEGNGMNETPTSKEAVILKLLEEGDTMLCLDARCQGVRVPPEHTRNPALRLILNLNFPHPIDVTDEGVSVNLAFGGRRTACYVPMEALWAAFNPETMQGMMWPDSMPPEVLADLAAQQQQKGAEGAPSETPDQPEQPRVISRKGQETTDKHKQDRSSGRQRGHLRVIK
jgi:stringent starvation protein B